MNPPPTLPPASVAAPCPERRAFFVRCTRGAACLVALPSATRWLAACGDNRPSAYPGASGTDASADHAGDANAQSFASDAPTAANGTRLTYADHPALATVGGSAVVSVGGRPLAVVRTGEATATVLSAVCPHQGCTIGALDAESQLFTCPCHGSEFDESGALKRGPATQGLTPYPATADATGISTTLS